MLNKQQIANLLELFNDPNNYNHIIDLIKNDNAYSSFLKKYSEERNQLLLSIFKLYFEKSLDKNLEILTYWNINDAVDDKGHNFLHWVAKSKQLNLSECEIHNLINLLVNFDVEIDAINKYKATPLHIAASHRNIYLIQALLSNSAKKLTNKSGMTYLDSLQQYGLSDTDNTNIVTSKDRKTYESSKNLNKTALNYIVNDENAPVNYASYKRKAFIEENLQSKKPKKSSFSDTILIEKADKKESLPLRKQKNFSFSDELLNNKREAISEIQQAIETYEKRNEFVIFRAIYFKSDPKILENALNDYFKEFSDSYILSTKENFICFFDETKIKNFKNIFKQNNISK